MYCVDIAKFPMHFKYQKQWFACVFQIGVFKNFAKVRKNRDISRDFLRITFSVGNMGAEPQKDLLIFQPKNTKNLLLKKNKQTKKKKKKTEPLKLSR